MNADDRGRLDRLARVVRHPPDPAAPGWKVQGLRVLRTLVVLGRDLTLGQLTLRAMSLVYTTLLSIVPLLALSFSVLKAFGVSNQIRPMLLSFLAPLGAEGEDVANRIVTFIENMNVGVLGALGLALLLYTAISLMQKIEESLNFIWHVQQPRSLGERFSRYLSVLMVGPILIFAALGITASVMNLDTVRDLLAVNVLGDTLQFASRLMPYLLVIAAFTFVYLFIPNTTVGFGAALVGGAVGGVVWQTAGWLFALFVASSNSYAAIYSGFAILVLFMVWLYLSWLILLFGASVAFYVKHPEYLYATGGEPRLSNRLRERLALSLMSLVAGRFLAGERMLSMPEITRLLGVPMHALVTVVGALERSHIIVQSQDAPPVYLPARDLSTITVVEVLEAVRAAGEEHFFLPNGLLAPDGVDGLIDRLHEAARSALGTMTLRDLAAESGKVPGVPTAPRAGSLGSPE